MTIPIKLDPRAVQKAIRNIEGADLGTVTISELENFLVPILRRYAINAPRYSPPLYVYRGRICEKPSNISEIGYPPAEFTQRGRANDIGETLFYATTARSVPFFELDVQPDCFLSLSQWKTEHHLLLNHIGFSSEPDSFLESTRSIDEIYQFVKSTRSLGDINSLVYDYLAAKFSHAVTRNNQDYYKLTVAISRKMFQDDIFDGLLYPTIQMKGNADNITLKPTYADSSLKFVSTEYIYVKSTIGMKYDIDVLDSATRLGEDGTLRWSGRGLNWALENKDDQLEMVSEGCALVAYDTAGNRIDPV